MINLEDFLSLSFSISIAGHLYVRGETNVYFERKQEKKQQMFYRKNLQSNDSNAPFLLGVVGGLIAFHEPSICFSTQCNDKNGTRRTRNLRS